MCKQIKSILYVRLPCWKIYPGGIIYVADFIHKQRPYIQQEILDMALIDKSEREETLRQKLLDMKPDAVAFSWRNMQSFGPNPDNDALDVVMTYDHSDKLINRLVAAQQAVSIIYDYSASRINNFKYMRLVRQLLPKTRIVVGGTAVSLFAPYIIDKCPNDTVVTIGEGEDAMLSVVDGFTKPEGDYVYKGIDGIIRKGSRRQFFDLRNLTAVNFKYIQSIFPGLNSYLKDEFIGVQTKRGCPYKCMFCLYNSIEGRKQRYRDPEEVAKEVKDLNSNFGIKHIWFTDAQFCSTLKSVKHIDNILDSLIAKKTSVSWTGYLRLDYLDKSITKKMIKTGICSIDTTFTGSQEIIDKLTLGYSLKKQMDVFRMFSESGHTNQKIKLYMPLNAPGETKATLQKTIERVEELYEMFGRENVLPFIFFIGIQPNTPVEKYLKDKGYLRNNYNPLTLNPFAIKKLLYNPPPLGKVIGSSYLDAIETAKSTEDYVGRATMDILDKKLSFN